MPYSWKPSDHPYLTDANSERTSEIDPSYNCISWAADDVVHFWWPAINNLKSYWPKGVSREITFKAFIQAFGTLGYSPCKNGTHEKGFEKVAFYGTRNFLGDLVPTHAAKQLADGKWTSKMGPLEDITHNTEHDVNGPIYGEVVCYLIRPRVSTPAMEAPQPSPETP